jgi:polyhydroxyalkanoate synthesis regulator phasin
MDNNNWLQQILMLGIGTTSLVADRVREVSEQWVKEGKIDPEQAKSFVDDLMQQMKLDPVKQRWTSCEDGSTDSSDKYANWKINYGNSDWGCSNT